MAVHIYDNAARTKVATVAVGYADGWLRSLGNCGSAFFPVTGCQSLAGFRWIR